MPDCVLALVDGSTHSDGVCHHAAWVASRLGAGVDLLHVLDRRDAPTGELVQLVRRSARPTLLGEPARAQAERARLAQAKARALLEYACKTVARGGAGLVNQRLWHGRLASRVNEFLDEFAAHTCAIVVGKRGRAADVAPRRLGATVEPIVRASRLPVLVAVPTFRPITRAMVAVDGSAGEEHALKRLVGSGILAGLELTLVHAGTGSPAMREHLNRAVQRLGLSGIAARADIVPGTPRVVLPGKAKSFDLLVMGAYGHSRLRSLVVGSTTTAVIQAAQVPVLLHR